MSYWARVKAAALGSDLITNNPQQPKTQPQKPTPAPQVPAQPAVNAPAAPAQPQPAVAPAPTGEEQLGNQFMTRQKGLRKTPAQLQAPIDGQLNQFMNELNKNPTYEPIRQKYQKENKDFVSAIGSFFNMTDKDMAMGRVWYRLLTLTDPKRFPDAQAVKKILEVNPEGVAQEVKKVIDSKPAFVYDIANQYAYKADSQFAGTGLSTNDQVGGGSGKATELGDMGGQQSYEGSSELVEQEEQKNMTLPERHEMADFWSRQNKNTIIAPEMTPEEAEEIQMCFDAFKEVGPQAISELRDHLIFNVPGPDGKPLSDSMEPNFRERVIQDGIKWAFQGISENEKVDGDMAMTNWQEYAKAVHGIDPKTTDMGEIMGIIGQDLFQVSKLPDEQKQEAPIMKFIRDKAAEYMVGVHDISRTNKLFEVNDFRPRRDDLKSFRRMAKIAYACSQREYRFTKAQELAGGTEEEDKKQDKAGTALRRGAYVKAKINSIIDNIDKVLAKPVGTFVPFGDPEPRGEKKYLHMDHTGHLAIRTVEFPRGLNITNEQDLQAYIKNTSKGQDEPLTLFNFSDIAGMIPNTAFGPNILDEVARTDPAGLKKKQTTNPDGTQNITPLSKTLSEQPAQPGVQADPMQKGQPRGLDGYRKALAAHVKSFVDKAGGPEAVVAKLKQLPTNKGERASDEKTCGQWLNHIMSGTPVQYAGPDFAVLGKVLGVPAEELYAPYAYEYDKYNIDDLNDISANMYTTPAIFLRYFIHRKRIQKQRGFSDQNWANKAMASFYHMCKPHSHYSNYMKPDPEAELQGKPFYDAIDKEAPMHNTLPRMENGEHVLDPKGNPIRDKITGPEQAMELGDRMDKLKPGDIYFKRDKNNPELLTRKPHLRPSSPSEDMLRPDDKGGFEGSVPDIDPATGQQRKYPDGRLRWKNPKREADWTQMWNAVMESYKAAHPDAASMGTVELLGKMKEEKAADLQSKVQSAQGDVEHFTGLLSNPEDAHAETLADIFDQDREVRHHIKQLQQTGATEEQIHQQAEALAEKRLQDLAAQEKMDVQQYALKHVQDKIKSSKRVADEAGLTLQTLKNADPAVLMQSALKGPDGKRLTGPAKKLEEKKVLKKLIDMLVPNKYKTHRYTSPEEAAQPGPSKFKPLDFVTDFDEVPAAEATAAALNLFIKTSSSFDKLYEIRSTLSRLAMPTKIVDDLVDRVDDEYERQMVIIMRRLDGRGNTPTASTTARQASRRLWSLL